MKKIALLICFASLLNLSFAQVDGILVYENNYADALGTGSVTTTFYHSKSKVRVESTNVQTKSALGAPSTKDQNVILFDFEKLTETHLDAKRNLASITGFATLLMEQQIKLNGTEITVQNIGTEKIGSYNCTHYVITTSNPKFKSPPAKKDIWITRDIGVGNLFYVSPYLYYPQGSLVANKLKEAGAEGVVVKWQILDPISKKPNICNLLSYQKKSLPPSTFAIPSGYQVMQR